MARWRYLSCDSKSTAFGGDKRKIFIYRAIIFTPLGALTTRNSLHLRVMLLGRLTTRFAFSTSLEVSRKLFCCLSCRNRNFFFLFEPLDSAAFKMRHTKTRKKMIFKSGELLACKSRPDNEEILRPPDTHKKKTSQESSMLLFDSGQKK